MSQTNVKHKKKSNQKDYHEILEYIRMYFLQQKLKHKINDRTTGKINNNQNSPQTYIKVCYDIESKYSRELLLEMSESKCIDLQTINIIFIVLTIISMKRVFAQVGYII